MFNPITGQYIVLGAVRDRTKVEINQRVSGEVESDQRKLANLEWHGPGSPGVNENHSANAFVQNDSIDQKGTKNSEEICSKCVENAQKQRSFERAGSKNASPRGERGATSETEADQVVSESNNAEAKDIKVSSDSLKDGRKGSESSQRGDKESSKGDVGQGLLDSNSSRDQNTNSAERDDAQKPETPTAKSGTGNKGKTVVETTTGDLDKDQPTSADEQEKGEQKGSVFGISKKSNAPPSGNTQATEEGGDFVVSSPYYGSQDNGSDNTPLSESSLELIDKVLEIISTPLERKPIPERERVAATFCAYHDPNGSDNGETIMSEEEFNREFEEFEDDYGYYTDAPGDGDGEGDGDGGSDAGAGNAAGDDDKDRVKISVFDDPEKILAQAREGTVEDALQTGAIRLPGVSLKQVQLPLTRDKGTNSSSSNRTGTSDEQKSTDKSVPSIIESAGVNKDEAVLANTTDHRKEQISSEYSQERKDRKEEMLTSANQANAPPSNVVDETVISSNGLPVNNQLNPHPSQIIVQVIKTRRL